VLPSAKVTIADVARLAGVSTMTVSRVLNRPASVSEVKREAVEQAIRELNYSPNPAARALAGGAPAHLVLCYDNPSSAYLSAFLLGAIEATQRLHARLTIIKLRAGHEKSALADLSADRAQGVLLPPPLCDSAKLHSALREAGLPAVCVAGGAAFPHCSSVRIDDRAAAAQMTTHLLALGHRRIGFICGTPDQAASAERLRGYQLALARHNLPQDEALITQGRFTYRSGLAAAETLLSLASPPTAIFASNDDMAAAAVSVAHRLHLAVPGQLSVCGFDDTDLARSTWPELTTVHQPISAMASTAVALLLDHLRDPHLPPKTRLLNARLVRRASDAGPAAPPEPEPPPAPAPAPR